MIILHRKKNDPESDTLEEKLNDLVIAFDIVFDVTDEASPFIEESGKLIKGKEAIEKWLLILEDELTWQRSLSGDACYIDPKTGDIC